MNLTFVSTWPFMQIHNELDVVKVSGGYKESEVFVQSLKFVCHCLLIGCQSFCHLRGYCVNRVVLWLCGYFHLEGKVQGRLTKNLSPLSVHHGVLDCDCLLSIWCQQQELASSKSACCCGDRNAGPGKLSLYLSLCTGSVQESCGNTCCHTDISFLRSHLLHGGWFYKHLWVTSTVGYTDKLQWGKNKLLSCNFTWTHDSVSPITGDSPYNTHARLLVNTWL